ncbi:MAG: hypothetical protein J6V54_04260 [Bacteroidales bacterium]|nr:hypothetical protein [Bacteroidales bacterium]
MNKVDSEKLTGLYSLSKTLRFELKPEPATKERFDKWLKEIEGKTEDGDEIFVEYDENNMFGKDVKIANAYKVLKTVLDKIHEEFITKSLSSDIAKKIDFSEYYNTCNNDKKKARENLEKTLRDKVGETFSEGKKYFSEEIGNVIKKKESKSKKKKESYGILDNEVFDYIKENVDKYASEDISKEKLNECLEIFKDFHTYFKGYNTNRSNYYEKKEQSTAVATRIVHENLPKFCNNAIRFEKRKDDYIAIYNLLKEQGKETILKNEDGEEVEAIPITEDIFQITHFNKCLTQKEIEDYNKIIGNYNLLINLYNQNRRNEKGFEKLDEFETLYKQIGCGKRKSFIISLQKDKESELEYKEKNSDDILSVEKLLKTALSAGEKVFKESENNYAVTLPKFIAFLKEKNESNNWSGIYWSGNAIDSLSTKYFTNWHTIKDLLKGNKGCTKKCTSQDEDTVQLLEAVELSDLFSVLNSVGTEYVFKNYLIENKSVNKDLSVSVNLINLLCNEIENKTKLFLDKANKVIDLKCYKDKKVLNDEEDENVNQVDEWFKYATNSMAIVRYFSVRKNKIKGSLPDTEMENMLNSLLHNDKYNWFRWYDLLHNYLSKKPQDDVKDNMLKLNFGKGDFLNGFVDSHTKKKDGTQYGGYIFRKKHLISGEYEYYLGISNNDKLFRCHLKNEVKEDDKSDYERLEYYQIGAKNIYRNGYKEKKKLIQKLVKELTYTKTEEERDESERINKTNPKGEITPLELFKRLSESEYFKEVLNNNQLLEVVNDTINLLVDNCKNYTRLNSLERIVSNEYVGFEGLKSLINDIEEITSKNKTFLFFNVSSEEFDKHNGEDLFLFKIANKDLSYSETYSKGIRRKRTTEKENLHTLFFRALMHEDGFADCVDIGSGEIFFRKKAFEYDKKTLERGHHAEELKGKFSYPIISNKRFSEDKYIFHLSVTLNYKDGNQNDDGINSVVNDVFQKAEVLNFIGIDRGEKHLVYSCIIDSNGKIVDNGCKHYDVINGTNYVEKLEVRADERDKARKNMQRVKNISNLKDGYISHVVHGLTNTIIKDKEGNINPHAYIVLEDLSRGMKDSRQKIEKQVYQKLETALAKKLNFVVDKEAKNGEIGSVGKALQLTPPFGTYQDIEGKKQFGVMLYTRANYTSVTDPATGWRKTIYLKNGKIDGIKEQIMDKFTDFGFDGKDYYFTYKENNVGKEWVMYSGKDGVSLPRFQNKKSAQTDYDIWIPEQVDIVGMLNKIFEGFDKTKSFKDQIIKDGREINKLDGRNETAWQSLVYVINVIQQIRNSGKNEKDEKDDNFLYSPVRNEKGEHFDTRNHINNGDLAQIVDADANGAYNIARKGLIMHEHIKYAKGKGKEPDLFISDREWDMWLLNREEWEKYLPEFALRKESKSKK